ncbi:MAG: metalloregulator ArsR/SmtB family transcription factor [bacterium]|nr:metalloregulator ArsR/SmtB family transcription factor [bacterium]
MRKYADILKVLGDPKRLKLFTLLAKKGDKFYVCELADSIEDTHYNTSRHLNELRKAGLVEEQKIGRGVMYYIPEFEDPFFNLLVELIKSIPDEAVGREMELLEKRVSFRGEDQRCVLKIDHDWKSENLEDKRR